MLRSLGKVVLRLAGVFALAGCSSTDVLDFITPRSGYTLHRNIAYGNEPRQQLDIYVPDHPASPPPVVLFFHGGSWKKGDKDEYRFVGQALTSRGYIAVIINYRLYPDFYYPTFMQDAASALSWVHAHAGEYGGNADNIFLSGHSAGAHIAVMLTVNKTFLEAAGGNSAWIRGTMGISGPYDFLPMTNPDVIGVFSKVKDTESQPITYARSNTPPMLLMTSNSDTEVGVKNSVNLAAKLREYGNTNVKVQTYPDVGHIGIVLALSRWFRGKAPVLDDMDAFIRAQAKP